MKTGDPNRKGNWFVTYTGKEFYPLDPHVEDIDIRDIAHSLSLQSRWMGHCKNFYSIASHCLACAKVAEKTLFSDEWEGRLFDDDAKKAILQWCLMHDASEAYMGDIVRPFKESLGVIKPSTGPNDPMGLLPIKMFEEQLQRLIAERFNLPWPMPSQVKTIDNRMLITEAKANTNYFQNTHWIHQKPWSEIQPYANDGVLLWQTSEMAEKAFLERAEEYLGL